MTTRALVPHPPVGDKLVLLAILELVGLVAALVAGWMWLMPPPVRKRKRRRQRVYGTFKR